MVTMARARPDNKDEQNVPPAVEEQINRNLRLLYEQRLEQELPDRLKDLVAQLRSGGAGQ